MTELPKCRLCKDVPETAVIMDHKKQELRRCRTNKCPVRKMGYISLGAWLQLMQDPPEVQQLRDRVLEFAELALCFAQANKSLVPDFDDFHRNFNLPMDIVYQRLAKALTEGGGSE